MYLGEIVEIGPRAAVFEQSAASLYAQADRARCRSPIRRGADARARCSAEDLPSPDPRGWTTGRPARSWRNVSADHLVQEEAVTMRNRSSAVFYRDLTQRRRRIVRGEGVYLEDSNRPALSRWLGQRRRRRHRPWPHGDLDALAREGDKVTFVYNATFTHPWQEELAQARARHGAGQHGGRVLRLRRLGGERIGLEAGAPIFRRARPAAEIQGDRALAELSRRDARDACRSPAAPRWRQIYSPLLLPVPHIAPPYEYRCAFCAESGGCSLAMRRRSRARHPARRAGHGRGVLRRAHRRHLGRRPDAASRLLPARARDLRQATTCCSSPTRCCAAMAAPAGRSRFPPGTSSPTSSRSGKAIGSGYAPLGAMVISERIREAFARRHRPLRARPHLQRHAVVRVSSACRCTRS